MPDRRVLVVDDERSMRELLAIMLKQAGHDVTLAEGGEQAVEVLKSESFDLVITDLRMRKVDGLAVLRATKEHSPHTVVLVVTAFASTETAVEAMKLGAYDYITQPFGHVKGAFTGAVANTVGLFFAANGGTLFLDEVTEVPQSVQVKLLRVIQEREIRRVGDTRDMKVDVRLIAASNRDIAKAVADGILREDLFYRLNVIPIQLPPLRERRDDISLLAEHFVRKISAELGKVVRGVSPEALAILESYRWPGNVRELENVIERALVLGSGDILAAEALPPDLHQIREPQEVPVEIPSDGLDLEATLDQIEHRYLQMALARTGGVQTRAAELLRVSFRQFRYKLQKHGQRTPSRG